MNVLTRSSLDLSTTGRTLEGLAFRWDHPSMVQDPGSPRYLEEFARGSATKTITERASFPLFAMHQHQTMPLGVANFRASAEGLVFSAPLSKTTAADEALELVNDGALRSVSVGYRAVKNGRRSDPRGPVTVRQEIGLMELSLAPTGFGQHEGAAVLAVRSLTDTPRLDAARRRAALLVTPA